MSESLAIIPHDENDLYALLPAEQKTELDLILTYLPSIVGAKSTLRACRDTAAKIGMSERQLYDRVCNYLNKRDWKCLVNKARAGAVFWQATKRIALPASFQMFYRGLCEKSQRSNAGGRRELMRIWMTRHDFEGNRFDRIPGYAEWPKAGVCGYPTGWSERNLNNYGPDDHDAAAARIGAFAASQFRPSVRKTRTTLKFGEQWQFDDHEYNVMVHFPAQPKALRPRGFGAAECLTDWIKPVFKMTLWNEEEEKKQTLREIDFQWFALSILSTIGYRTDEAGTMLMGERGLSVFRKEFGERLKLVTGGRVTCPMPGAINERAHKGQFANTTGKSNFKRKPIIEGAWSVIDNYFDRLPGQTGINAGTSASTKPEELAGREQELKLVLKASETLAVERAELLRLPFLTYSQFLPVAERIFSELLSTPDHEIEGWDRIPGFHIGEWRINTDLPWLPMQKLLALPENEQVAVKALLKSAPPGHLSRARNLSRQEAFQMKHAEALQRGEMARLSPTHWPHLMGLRAGRRVVVNKESKFSLTVRELGTTPLEYLASVKGRHLDVGAEFLGYINPWMPEAMVLCKPNGAVLGLCEQWDRPGMNDAEGIRRMAGKQAQWEAQRRHGLNERHAARAAEIAHMQEHNQAVIAGRTISAAEQERRQKETDMAGMAEAILSQPCQ